MRRHAVLLSCVQVDTITSSYEPMVALSFRRRLLRWFDTYRRELPWRKDRDPYRVWISEIMLQQTRVAAAVEHYRRFLERFPDVHRLARARRASVLAAWSGLGYYRRAHLLHLAARQIARQGYPRDAAGWQMLPGVGRYTAAAIASICHQEPCAVVDGNVKRVLSRLLASTPADPWTTAQQLLSRSRPGDFNQAMMELGATVCTPRNPGCAACPVAAMCRSAHQPGNHTQTTKFARTKSALTCALIRHDRQVFLVQRRLSESVMPGLWELPPAAAAASTARPLMVLRHAIMNTDYRVTVLEMSASEARGLRGRWFDARRAAALPLTGLARKILHRSHII